ncbi:MAG TPA: gluconate 2-dehydrogenase subunit 3 family protein [Gemmatimonadaceae bacterium]|nr:gluconate 2-dehydrogenase subunit 3 family protein [Gemmatimonadaceae bacterium]
MERRDLLRAFGAATALALLPHDAVAAWARVASGLRPSAGLSDAQLALVGAIADIIIPRTDTPGASDVGVPAFVDVVVTENYGDAERTAFLAGLDAIDAQAKNAGGAAFVDLAPAARVATIEAIESAGDRRSEPNRTYWRLKGLIVHGYFTSEPVMKKVLKVEIMPGRFDGAAPMPPKAGRVEGGEAHG